MGIHSEMGAQSRSKRRNNVQTSLALRGKELLTGSAPSSSKKRSGDEVESQRPSKKFHLVVADESKKSTASPSALQGKGDVVVRTTMTTSHVLPQADSVATPLRTLPVSSSLLPSAPSIANHSSEWDEQEDYDDDEQSAINFAMGLPIFNVRATDITKLLGAYDPLEDEDDDEERFGEPLEGFHPDIYKLAGLDANGEEISNTDSVDSSGDEFDSNEDEFDSDEENEYDYSEYGDEELDKASLVSDDEEKEEWEEHEDSDADLDAEEGVSASGDERDDEETELEGEEERKGGVLLN